MASELRVVHRPRLESPVLIAAFRGWNDGGQGASLAGGFLAREWQAERFADLDPENFYDFQATRPMVTLEDGETRTIEWPENAFYFARPRELGRDAILLLGVEPNVRWRTFSEPDRRLREGARRRDGHHARRAAGGRAAHAPEPGYRQRNRPQARRGARPLDVPLRGPDRRRRRAARRVQQGRHPVGEPLGRRPALRAADAEPARRAGAVRTARHAARRPHRRCRAPPRRPRLRRAGERGGRQPTPRRPRTSRSSSSARHDRPGRASRPATRSPPS